MHIKELDFSYPDELVALEPKRPSRVMWVGDQGPQEISIPDLINAIPAGDVLVINDTKVLKRRIFVPFKRTYLEVLFLTRKDPLTWEVLFPAKEIKIGHVLDLPDGVKAELIEKGRPQLLKLSRAVDEKYFARNAELPLPPYIQKLRASRHTVKQDDRWYQTVWAKNYGSLASPTASLHFQKEDMEALANKGVIVVPVTLHVGLGTFLPVTTEKLEDFQMHSEVVEVPVSTWDQVQQAKARGAKVWTMGTTATRAVESVGNGLLPMEGNAFKGTTNIFITPGYKWTVVDRLLTNFHQPESTLIALVAAFSSLEKVKAYYQWAIEKKFRLFSYGDLSVWLRD